MDLLMHRFSSTAEAAAFGRALESDSHPDGRLFNDTFAHCFLSPRWRAILALCRLPGMRDVVERIQERRFPGVFGNLVCRTRFIDDSLRNALKGGVRQIVILGTGFDSRAYRIQDVDYARVFEVDRLAMLTRKQQCLRTVLNKLPLHVNYVPSNFHNQQLCGELKRSGFRPEVQTLFLWEGVTQYITLAAMNGVFRDVAQSASGSRLVFTYIDQSVLDGSGNSDVDQRLLSTARRMGEPWISGFAPTRLADDLRHRGLCLVDHVGAADYLARYLLPMGRSLTLYDHERVAVAEVLPCDKA